MPTASTIGNRIVTSSHRRQLAAGAINYAAGHLGHCQTGRLARSDRHPAGVTAFLNGLSTLTQGVDLTANYPTDFGDYGLVDWTLAGNYNQTTVSRRRSAAGRVCWPSNSSATFFNSQFAVQLHAPAPRPTKIGLRPTGRWTSSASPCAKPIMGRSTAYTSPNSGGTYYPFNQAGVGLTDLELRYNVTEELQFAFGGNNIFNIPPDLQADAPASCTGPGLVHITAVCTTGPNNASGQGLTLGNGSVEYAPFGTVWNPNGGYYYARFVFNF